MNKDLKKLLEQFKSENYSSANWSEEKIFTLFCMKYFFYEASFAPSEAEEYVVDGANDGGIDAVFNDPNSDENDVIIIQSKLYKTSKLTADMLIGDVTKINSTLVDFKKNEFEHLNRNVQSKLSLAMDQIQNDGKVVIHYFTSYETKTKVEYNSFNKRVNDLKLEYEVVIHFGQDVLETVNLVESGNMSVPNAKLSIDKTDNYLEYEESIIANVNAKSILDLYNNFKDKGLFAQNLRYYIKDKNVDKGIKETLKDEPENFWFYNNGLIIMADDLDISGKEIKLTNFSIINGGQTTSLIGLNGNLVRNLDIYVPVKIIKTGMKVFREGDDFASKVARASNSQKAIKAKDLMSNKKEQIELKSKLSLIGVYYELKRGEKRADKYKKFLYAKIDQVTKLLATSILQIPGTARSNTNKLYSEGLYYNIFSQETKAEVVKDLLILEKYYKAYQKQRKSEFSVDEMKYGIMNNGFYFVISSLVLAIAIQRRVIDFNTKDLWDNEDRRKQLLKPLSKIDRLFVNKEQDEERYIFSIYDILLTRIASRYEVHKEVSEQNGDIVVPSNFTKLDANYYKHIVPHIYILMANKELQDLISKVFIND
ncbi:AIPR family protein [Haploplasma axanthum]|nr:AIPR family protein [Haploplasma axanthum]